MARLFVAAALPDHVRAEVAALVPRSAEPGLRWVPEHQWHVTLRFLGEADEHEALTALAGLAAPGATARLGPRVSRLGRDVVCLPVTGLDDLADAVRACTAHVGVPPGRPFVGHVTLGRLRRHGACGVTGTAVDASFAVEEVVLVRSTLGDGGARHEAVGAVPLAGVSGPGGGDAGGRAP